MSRTSLVVLLVGAALVAAVVAAPAHAEDVDDKKSHFHVTIPEGFQAVPEAVTGSTLHAYKREGITGGNIGVLITLQDLGGTIGREPLTNEDVAKFAPGATVSTEAWKTFSVSVIRTETQAKGRAAVAYGAQIPIAPRAIQINVAGELAEDAEVHAVLTDLLRTMDGESSWLSDGDRTKTLIQWGVRAFLLVLLILVAIAVKRRLA